MLHFQPKGYVLEDITVRKKHVVLEHQAKTALVGGDAGL